MNQKEFTEKYSIGDCLPSDPASKLICGRAFAEAISEFVDERFRAVAEVNTFVESEESVLVSLEYSALFLKKLFTFVFGRVYLHIDIREQDGKITVSISSDEPLPISKKEMDTLTKAARSAGMTVLSVDGEMIASLDFVDKKQFSVYAASYTDSKMLILRHLERIFFGE